MQNASNRPCRVFCLTPVPSDFLLLPNLFKPIFLPYVRILDMVHFTHEHVEGAAVDAAIAIKCFIDAVLFPCFRMDDGTGNDFIAFILK